MRSHSTPLAFLLLAGAARGPLLAQGTAAPAAAEAEVVADQEGDEELADEEEAEAIVVTGQRPRGAVEGDIPPETQLNGREIRALGASNLAELLDALAPQTRSGRGRGGEGPVVLLNGRRISGFSEIRGIPPEAIERVDILPEEVALKYGYRADQRVVNFVLRPRFRAVTAEVEAGFATRGGRESGEADFNLLRISGKGRWSVDAEYQQDAALLESERDLIQSPSSDPGAPALGEFRTLMPASEQLALNGTVNRAIFGDVSATLNGRYEVRRSDSLLGLPSFALIVPETSPFSRIAGPETVFRYAPAAGALERSSDSRNGHLGVALNGNLRPWRWSVTGNWDRNASETRTGTGVDPVPLQGLILAGDASIDPFGDIATDLFSARAADRSRTISQTANAEAVLNGPLFTLPAGDVSTTFKASFDTRRLESRTLRSGVGQLRDLSRDRGNGQVSLDVPIASRREGFLEAIGNLSVNLNAAFEHLSDFGTLRTLGAGVNWSPIEQVSLIASVTDEDGAPSMQQIGDPILLTPNVRVFDFVLGETVDIDLLTGGNPAVAADNRRVLKIGATVRPLKETDLSITANYTDNRIDNPIASFPVATAEIEAAFPDRFQRGSDGRLLRIDTRPVNFARSERRELRWGVNFSKPLGPQGRPGGPGGRRGGQQPPAGGAQTPPTQPGQPGQAPTQGAGERPGREQVQPEGQAQGRGRWGGQRGPGGEGGFRGGGGRGAGGFGGGRGGRLQLGLYHTWRFEDSVLIREGVPELDFLNGSAAGGRGGRPRHELELQASLFKNGFGGRLTADWQQGTFVAGATPAQDLFFSDQATLNLRLFANLGQQRSLVREIPFLRGSRVSLAVDNLLDTRPRVRDAAGATPLGYQPAYLDPLGRTVRISFRKLFF
jgi:hypothetical protein